MLMKNINYPFLLFAFVFWGCTEEARNSNDDQSVINGRDTWKIIQEDIFLPNCVDCHTAGTSFANQSNLVLTQDVAYDQLINQPADNQAASNDGLERLGNEGLSSLYKSFFGKNKCSR